MAKELTEDEILAYTLLGEAGGEGAEGMAAVMHVLMNRKESGNYGTSLKGIALKKNSKGTYQFTTWSPSDGNSPTTKWSKTSAAFKEALSIVNAVKTGAVPDPTGGAQNYYANSGAGGIKKPWWFDAEAPAGSVQIGNHLFAAKSGVDPKAKVNYPQQLSAAMQGTAFPQTPSSAVALSRKIDYLPASREQLQLDRTTSPLPTGPTRGRGEAGAAMRSLNAVGSGLVTRKVTTVPINPLTGQPTTSAAAEAAKTVLRDRIAASTMPALSTTASAAADRNDARAIAGAPGGDVTWAPKPAAITYGGTTVTVRKDGTTTTQVKPGSVQMPADARPSVLPSLMPKLPVPNLRLPTSSPTMSPSGSAPITQNWTDKLVTRTILVKNPAYKPVGGAAGQEVVGKLPFDVNASVMGPQLTNPDYGAIEIPVTEYIEKQITVKERVLLPPSDPGVGYTDGGGGGGGGGSSVTYTPPPSQVTISTGKTAEVGQTYQQGADGSGNPYTYVVQSDGSIKNTTTGRITAPATR